MASMVRKMVSKTGFMSSDTASRHPPTTYHRTVFAVFAPDSAAIVDAPTFYDSVTTSGSWVSGIVQGRDEELGGENAGICWFARRGRVA